VRRRLAAREIAGQQRCRFFVGRCAGGFVGRAGVQREVTIDRS
jgi:hypothetical protein